jgi:hypothetical protein
MTNAVASKEMRSKQARPKRVPHTTSHNAVGLNASKGSSLKEAVSAMIQRSVPSTAAMVATNRRHFGQRLGGRFGPEASSP